MGKQGSIKFQLVNAFKDLKSFGDKKHEFQKGLNSHDFAANNGIFAYNTFNRYSAIIHEFGKYITEQKLTNNIMRVAPEHIQSWVKVKLIKVSRKKHSLIIP